MVVLVSQVCQDILPEASLVLQGNLLAMFLALLKILLVENLDLQYTPLVLHPDMRQVYLPVYQFHLLLCCPQGAFQLLMCLQYNLLMFLLVLLQELLHPLGILQFQDIVHLLLQGNPVVPGFLDILQLMMFLLGIFQILLQDKFLLTLLANH